MAGGAPSKYRDEYADQLIEYFDIEPYTETVDESGKIVRIGNKFPTLARFALNIGVHRGTLLNWADENDQFFNAMKKAKDYQEAFLVEAGLAGAVEKTFAIFTAKNVIGWTDKQQVESKVQINTADDSEW